MPDSNALAHQQMRGNTTTADQGAIARFVRGDAYFKNAPHPASALDHQEGGDHYKTLKIQPVEYIHANNLPFIEGSVVKYVTRWRSKGGVKDLEKARHFIDLLIELETTKE